MSTIRVNAIQNTSTTDGGISINNSGHVTVDGVAMPSSGPLSNRNLVINGAMQIDQRNAGASVDASNTGGNTYVLDRWHYRVLAASKFTIQQNAGSVTPPAGYTNYLGCTSSSAYTVGASELLTISQRIEGFNIANLGWGTASAKTVTLSFQVYSSLTGTFGGAIRNSAGNRSYPFSFDISSTNTWTPVSIIIPGETTGTWLTNNGTGIDVRFSLGAGSNYSQSAGSWYAGSAVSATGATSVVGTNGATFYLTGVQLEVGSVATPFEHRSYGDEYLRCLRYYYRFTRENSAAHLGTMQVYSSTNVAGQFFKWPIPMRAAPTFTKSGNINIINSNFSSGYAATFSTTHLSRFNMYAQLSGGSGLSAGHASSIYLNSTGDYIEFNAEL